MSQFHHLLVPHHRRRRSLGVASLGLLVVITSGLLVMAPATAGATILPPNDLWKQDNRLAATGITEQQFNSILDLLELRYRTEFFFFNANFVINRFWNDSTVNAFARRTGNDWIIDMYGGLARRSEITPDGFALVACHEIGHHLGGYPFYSGDWAATEGEADNYATQACARFIWRSDPANAQIASTAPQIVHTACDAAWTTVADRNLCARIALAGKSLGDLSGALEGHTVSFATPDSHVVTQTISAHPAAQCRLDTYVAGALCGVFFNFDIIPGIGDPIGPNSAHAEITAATTSCMPASALIGTPGYNGHDRPLCWFAPQVH
jgi:hypothetical protein